MASKPTYEELEQRVKRLEKESFEHKRAEEERDLTLSQFRATLEATVDGIIVVGLDSETKVFSKRFRKIWHMPDSVLDSEDANQVLDYVLDQINEPEVFSQKVQAVFADPYSNTFDTLHLKDGRVLEVYSRPQKLEDKMIGRVWAFRDVTKTKQAIMEQQKAQSRLQALSDASFEAIFFSDQGICIDQNSTAEHMFGYSHKEAVGRNGTEWIVPEDREKVKNNMLAGYEKPYEVTGLRKDGSTFPAEIQGHMLNFMGKSTRVTTLRDNSVQQQAREVLRESEALLRMAGRTARFGGWSSESDGHKAVWSEQVALIHEKQPGYSPTAKEAIQYYAPEWRDKIAAAFQTCIREGTPYDEELEIITAGGHRLWVRTTGEAVRDSMGKIVRVQGSFQDINERKRAEQALKNNQNFLNRIINQSPFATWISDEKGTIIKCNAALTTFLNITAEQLIDKYNVFEDEVAIEQGLIPKIRTVFEDGKTANFSVEWDANELGYKDAKKVHIEDTMFPIHDDKGDLINVVNHWIDITERKQSQLELKESEDKFRSFAEQSLVGIYLISGDVFKYVNPKFAEVFGYSVDECLDNMHFQQLVHPEDLATVEKQVGRRLSGETKAVRYSFRGIKKSGEIIHVEIFGSSMLLKGKIVVTGTMLDITDRKQAEEALRESEEKYRSLITNIPDVTWTTDYEGKTSFISPNIEKEYGYTPEEITKGGDNIWLGRIHPEDAEKVEKAFKELFEEGTMLDVEYRIKRKDGEWIWLYDRSVAIYERDGVMYADGIFTNITNRKQAEEALRESEAFIKAVLDNLPIGIAVNSVDPSVKFEYMNDNFPKCYRTSRAALADPDAFWNAVYEDPEFREAMKNRVLADCASGDSERMYWADVPITRKGAETSHITARNTPVSNKQLMISIVWDVTERKQAEEALRESEEKFRLISEQSLLAIGIIQDGHIIYANEMYSKLTGYSLEEIYGWEPYGYARTVYKDDLPLVMKQSRKKQTGDEDVITNYQFRGFTKSKEIVWWDTHSRTITYHGRPADLFTLIDITEKVESENDRMALQAKLQHAQKMEAIGTLAGGVAHDLNNILGGLVSYPELLLLQLPEDNPLRKSILTIQKSGEKAAAVVQDLLTLARRGVVVTEVVNLNNVISEYLKSPEHEKLQSYHPGVHIETHFEEDALNILGSSTHLSKTVMNLISNGCGSIGSRIKAINIGSLGDLQVKFLRLFARITIQEKNMSGFSRSWAVEG